MMWGPFFTSRNQAGRMIRSLLLATMVCQCATSPLCADEIDEQIDQSIVAALRFLQASQQQTGGWVVDSFGGEATSATSLAVMAFLAAGHVPGERPYGETLDRGIQFVLDHQEPNGMLIHRRGHGPMYCHGISTLMLAEVIGMTTDKTQTRQARDALERGVRLILQSQNVRKTALHSGGWRYHPASDDSDLSVTAWQLLALRAAKNIGCDIPAVHIDAAVDYVKRCHRQRGFGYTPGANPTPTMTGSGITALQVCGEYDTAEVRQGADFLLDRLPRYEDQWYFYGVYYTAVGLNQAGDKYWKVAKPKLARELLARQAPDGSWSAANSENAHGRVYCTSMAVLALAVDYGYLPIYQR